MVNLISYKNKSYKNLGNSLVFKREKIWFIPLGLSRLRPSPPRPITQIILVKSRYYVSIFIPYPESILTISI